MVNTEFLMIKDKKNNNCTFENESRKRNLSLSSVENKKPHKS